MYYPIIIKREIIDFLKAQNAVKIYEKLHPDLSVSCRIEVWLKDNTFITVQTQVKSDIVEKIVLYHAGDEAVQNFGFHGKSRASLDVFYVRIRNLKDEAGFLFPVNPWEPYCEIFDTKDRQGTVLNNAENLLNILKGLSTELRERFQGIEEMLASMLSENAKLNRDLRSGDLLKNGSGELYWFLKDKDEAGNYLFLNDSFEMVPFDYSTFKDWQKVDILPILDETLRRFYALFDSELIETVLKPVTVVLGYPPVDSATIEHNCGPFKQWVKRKKMIVTQKDTMGVKYGFEVGNQVEISVVADSMACFVYFKAMPNEFDGDSDGYSEELFNPFLYGISSYEDGITRILGLLSEIYEIFGREIAELNLTEAFIELYSMWEQIQDSVKELSGDTNEDLLNSLLTELKDMPVTPNSKEETYESMPWANFMQTADAAGFKIGWQGSFTYDDGDGGMEVIMYREDGLILYANSYLDDLDVAEVYGEITSDLPDSLMAEPAFVDTGKNGSVLFSTSVQCGMLIFLDRLKQVQLAPVWSKENMHFSVLNHNEWVSLELEEMNDSSDDGSEELQLQKLSLCCEEVKKILAPYFSHSSNQTECNCKDVLF